jgi:hypothetical protein
MERQPHRPGVVLGHYRISAFDGSGMLGELYRAVDVRVSEADAPLLALRVFDASAVGRSGTDSPFVRSGKLLKAIRHAHLVQVLAYGEADRQRFVVTPYAEGLRLNRLLLNPANRHPARIAQLTDAVCREIGAALAHVHTHGIIHGDINTKSILQTKSGQFMLAEIGVAYDFASEDDADARFLLECLTHASQQPDGRDDLFALGTVLYEMATGRPPYADAAQPDSAPPPISTDVLPQTLCDVIERLLQPNLNDRFATAQDMLHALSSAAQPSPLAIPAWTRRSAERTIPDAVVFDPPEPLSAADSADEVEARRTPSRHFRGAIAAAVLLAGAGGISVSALNSSATRSGALRATTAQKTGANDAGMAKPVVTMLTTAIPTGTPRVLATPTERVAATALPAATRSAPTPAPATAIVLPTLTPVPVTATQPAATVAPTRVATRPPKAFATRVPVATVAPSAPQNPTPTSANTDTSQPTAVVDLPTATAPPIDIDPDQSGFPSP